MYIHIYIIYIQYNSVLHTLKSTLKLNVPVRYALLSQGREFSFDLRLFHSNVMAILFGLDVYDVKIYFNASSFIEFTVIVTKNFHLSTIDNAKCVNNFASVP